ncbi:YbjQ family protein [Shinella kummerowiae]|uniref:YbjQ family protein n=1 Tax=Shinella kummerowiae TaxID=417745 RepID=UPI0021B4DB21|nr:YbjQ family protein [Shinella kummerowiae]MCT7662264.1 YbjQ family protein [Shinella kummerowiae]
MAICKDCHQDKPDSEVQLGICDHCFKFGPPKAQTLQSTAGMSSGPQGKTPIWVERDVGVVLTTSIDVPQRKIERIISIVAAETALGMNIFRDIANNWRDFVGGRANTSEHALKDARTACLQRLKDEAAAIGADAVIAVNLNYSELSTAGNGILFVAASGTAVKLAPQDAI